MAVGIIYRQPSQTSVKETMNQVFINLIPSSKKPTKSVILT